MIAFLGLLLVLSGPVVYFVTTDVPLLRQTGLLAYGLMGLGVVVGVIAVRRRRGLWPKIAFVLQVILVGVFAYGFEVWSRLPSDQRFAQFESAPDFTLLDPEGRSVSLSSAHANGPVLLVFYRGRW